MVHGRSPCPWWRHSFVLRCPLPHRYYNTPGHGHRHRDQHDQWLYYANLAATHCNLLRRKTHPCLQSRRPWVPQLRLSRIEKQCLIEIRESQTSLVTRVDF